MDFKDKLQLTYIPATYWNEYLSGFKLKSTEKEVPSDSNFFIAWTLTRRSEEDLTQAMKSVFPTIPTDKLLTCEINLASPSQNLNNKRNMATTSMYFEVVPVLGKIMPIAPILKLLFEQKIRETDKIREVDQGSRQQPGI